MLLAEIIFASRILGLVAGAQQIDIQVEAEVRNVEVRRDGQLVAMLRQPPWSTTVHFGPELAPHELTVVALDADGHELGRDTQTINVARPQAELGVLLDRDAAGRSTATIRWSHFTHRDPTSLIVKLDGRVIRKGSSPSVFPLGIVDASTIHVLGVEAKFPDRVQSRKEFVFGGGFSEQMPAELTPVAVRQRTKTPDGVATCFRAGGASLPKTTIERGAGTAVFVINGGRGVLRRNDLPEHHGEDLFLLHEVDLQIANPVPQLIRHPSGQTSIFDTRPIRGVNGTRRVVMRAQTPRGTVRIADAVAVSALRLLQGGRRRVVVVVLGDLPAADQSTHSPATVRRYLERVGVPLRVWSLTGPRPDLVETWGPVRDISTNAALLKATEDLRQELDSQRIAWLPVQPLDAFRVIASADCAYTPLTSETY